MLQGTAEHSFSINLRSLRMLGFYPTETDSSLYSVYGYILFLFCTVPNPLLCFLYFLQAEEIELTESGYDLFLMGSLLCYVPKFGFFITNRKKIKKCIHFFEMSVKIELNNVQMEIIDDCVRICHRNSKFFFWCIVVDLSAWAMRSLFLQERKLPMDVWLPYDPTTNVVTFYFTYTFIVIGVFYCGLATSAIDPLVAGLIYHAAGHIRVLKDNLQNLSEYADLEILNVNFKNNTETFIAKSRLIYKKLKECVKHHNAITAYIKEFESCFSKLVFSQFVGSIAIIGFCCLQLSKLEIGSISFILMACYLSSVLVQIFFYCYYGTTLYEESNTLTTAAYMGRWYEYDLKSKKALVFLMGKSNTSIVVTAGKFLELSLETFTAILKRSYSLLAVLSNN